MHVMTDRITRTDFARMFRLPESDIPALACSRIDTYDLAYDLARPEEIEEYALGLGKLQEDETLVRTREESRQAFERGWTENFEELMQSDADDCELALRPKYYRGSKFFRYNNTLVTTTNLQLEYELFVIARLCLFHRYLQGAGTICELGCGTCANLFLLSRTFPNTRLMGFDWTIASSKIARELGRRLSNPISGHLLDLLAPVSSVEIPEGAAIISIHAFEQLGTDYGSALDFIIRLKPSVVLQYEPVLEFYSDENFLDQLALRYCRKRGYLEGYYPRLLKMEREGKIKMIAAHRPYLGGVIHESSVLVWKPA